MMTDIAAIDKIIGRMKDLNVLFSDMLAAFEKIADTADRMDEANWKESSLQISLLARNFQ